MRYEGRNTQAISFPLGGIGTGCIGLAGNGSLIDWEIFNRPSKGSYNGMSFFAVKAEKEGKLVDARVMNGDLPAPYMGMPHLKGFAGYGFGPERYTLGGAPHFSRCAFEGSFPYARVELGEDAFPGVASVTAFNPFVPSNEEDSGIPAAFFTLAVHNDTADTLEYTFACSLQNPRAAALNREAAEDGLHMITLASGQYAEDAPEYGTMCIGTDAPDAHAQAYWYRGAWFDSLQIFWQDFTAPGAIRARSYLEGDAGGYPGTGDTCTLTAAVRAAPGETASVRFVIAWHYPNFVNYWNPMQEETDTLKNSWKNYYAMRYADAKAAATYALSNWARLDGETRLFHEALMASTLPDYALDAVSSTLSVLKSPTVIRLQDGSFYGFEGCHTDAGCCEGSCTHVWNYAYALPFLFPRLERSLRETNYRYNQDPAGGMRFRTQLPLGRPYSGFRPCVDGQFGDVVKTYREWKLLGDDAWLRKLWPAVKRSIEYAWSGDNPDMWDANRDGVLEGRQHHTLDMEFFGPSAWLNGFYLAALKAGAEMAEAMGEPDAAGEYLRLYENGRAWVEANLFNGEYYGQQIDLKNREVLRPYGQDAYDGYWNAEAQEIKYQIDNGSSIDQLTGEWHAKLVGLGGIFDPAHVDSALNTIYHLNFRSMRDHFNPCRLYSLNDERGTVMCAWPEGVAKPVVPVPYAEETMYGFEYQAAVNMLLAGKVEQGLALIESIRFRHDGERRNPWNEMECGSNYARSMAAYSILLAASGFEFDMTKGHLGFRPIFEGESFTTFWSVNDAWGTYTQDADGARLTVLYGTLTLRSLRAGEGTFTAATLNGEPVGFAMADGCAVPDAPVTLRAGSTLALYR